MYKLENITKIYDKDLKALDNISMTLPDKGIVVFYGHSGCGKSTLLSIIAGFLSPTEGNILYNNVDISKLKSHDRNEYISNIVGYVFQENNLLVDYNIFDNIKIASSVLNKKVNEEEIDDLLKLLKIDDIKYSMPSEISGGQEQRAAIARCLIKNSKVLLLDEPTSALDEQNSINLINDLVEISKNKLVVVVTHDTELFLPHASQSYLFDKGILIKTEGEEFLEENNSIANEEPMKESRIIPLNYTFKFTRKIIKKNIIKILLSFLILLIFLTLINCLVGLFFYDGISELNTLVGNSEITLTGNSDSIIEEDEEVLYQSSISTYLLYDLLYDKNGGKTNNFYNDYYNNLNEKLVHFNYDFVLPEYTLYGSIPKTTDQITLSYHHYLVFNELGLITSDDSVIINSPVEDYIGVSINLDNRYYKIVGVIDFGYDYSILSKEDSTGFSFSGTIYNMIFTAPTSFKTENFIINSDNNNVKSILKNIYENGNPNEISVLYNGLINQQAASILFTYRNVSSVRYPGLLCVCIILFLICLLIMYSMINSKFIFKIKEIGILRSLGVRKTNISIMFFLETILEMIPSLICSFILTPFILEQFNKYLTDSSRFNSKTVSINYVNCIVILVVFIFICFLSSVISTLRFCRKDIVFNINRN